MNHSLFKNVLPVRMLPDGTSNTVAAGTTVLTSNSIDTQGYGGIAFMEAFGTITAGALTSFKFQHSNDDGVLDAYADVAGSSQTVADTDDNKVVLSTIFKPLKRYFKVITTRGTQNAVVDGLFAFLYLPENMPVTFGTTVQGTPEFFNSPASGTA